MSAQPTVAHDFQHPLAAAGGEDAIAGIRQPIKMEPAGQQRQRQHAEQRGERAAAPRLEQHHNGAGNRPQQQPHQGECDDTALILFNFQPLR